MEKGKGVLATEQLTEILKGEKGKDFTDLDTIKKYAEHMGLDNADVGKAAKKANWNPVLDVKYSAGENVIEETVESVEMLDDTIEEAAEEMNALYSGTMDFFSEITDIVVEEQAITTEMTALGSEVTVASTEAGVLGTEMAVVEAETTGATVAAGKFSTAIKGIGAFLTTWGPAVAGVTALLLAVAAAKHYEGDYNRKSEKFNEDNTKYQEDLSQLKQYNSKIQDIDSKIEEINSKDKLTFTDQAELANLQAQKAELEDLQNIQQSLVDTEKKRASDSALIALDSDKGTIDYSKTVNPVGVYDDKKRYGKTNLIKGQLHNIDALKEAQEELNKAQKAYDEDDKAGKIRPEVQKRYDNALEAVENIKTALEQGSSELANYKDSLDLSDDKAAEKYKEIEKAIHKTGDAMSESKSPMDQMRKNIEGAFTSADEATNKSRQELKQYLTEAVNDGQTASEALAAIGLTLDDINLYNIDDGIGGTISAVESLNQYFDDLKVSADETKSAIKEVFEVDGSFKGVEEAQSSANAGANWESMSGWLKNGKELYEKGLVGTDDFQTLAQFMSPKQIKVTEGFNSDAYIEAWKKAQKKIERYFDSENPLDSMINFRDDGIGKIFEWVDEDTGEVKNTFKTTAEAADKMGLSVEATETILNRLKDYGFEFDGVEWSGQKLDEYRQNLENIQQLYNEMEEGEAKDRLGLMLKGFNEDYETYQEDLSKLDEEAIVNIKFEYDLATVEKEIEAAKNRLEAGWNQEDATTVIANSIAERKMLEEKTGITSENDDGYKKSFEVLNDINKEFGTATEERKEQLRQEMALIIDTQNGYLNAKKSGEDVDFQTFYENNKDAITSAYSDMAITPDVKTEFTEDFDDILDIEAIIDAKIKVDETKGDLEKQLDELSKGGNVDLKVRPVIDSSELNEKGWDAGEGKATVFTSTYSNEDGNVAMNFTPIMTDKNGKYKGVLSPQELQEYAEGVIAGTREDDLNLKIGMTYEGSEAIANAEADAQKIHELHEDYFLENGKLAQAEKELQDQIGKTQQSAYNNGTAKEQAKQNKELAKSFVDQVEAGKDATQQYKQLASAAKKQKRSVDELAGSVNGGTEALREYHREQALKVDQTKVHDKENGGAARRETNKPTTQKTEKPETTKITPDIDIFKARQQMSELTTIPEAQTITVSLVGEDKATPMIDAWNQLEPDEQFAKLSGEDQATAIINLWNSLSPIPQFAELNGEDKATWIIDAWNILSPEEKTALINGDNTDAMSKIRSVIDNNIPNKTFSVIANGVGSALSAVSMLKSAINGLTSKTINLKTIKTTVTRNISDGGAGGHARRVTNLYGTAHASGTFSPSWISGLPDKSLKHTPIDTSNYPSKWQTKSDEQALVGEVAPEMVVNGNRWWLVGQNGPEFTHIPAHSVVFNSKQTEELLSSGATDTRGEAHLSGTAYAKGSKKKKESDAQIRKKYNSIQAKKKKRKKKMMGNVDLNHRPIVLDGDGYHTLLTTTFLYSDFAREGLKIPPVHKKDKAFNVTPIYANGKWLKSYDSLFNRIYDFIEGGGKLSKFPLYMGSYKSLGKATKAAISTHNSQAKMYDEEAKYTRLYKNLKKKKSKLLGSAFAHGSIGTLQNDQDALINETGKEGIVRDGKLFTVNNGKPTITGLKRGDVVLNTKQMEQLQNSGKANSYGRIIGGSGALFNGTTEDDLDELAAFVGGTAYFGNGGKITSKGKPAKSSSTPSDKNKKDKTTKTKSTGKSNTNTDPKKKKSTKKAKSAMDTFSDWVSKLFDWIEVRLDRLSDKTERWTTAAEKAVEAGSKAQQTYYQNAIKATSAEITANEKAESKYEAQAKKVGKKGAKAAKIKNPDKWVNSIYKKLQNGTLKISEYSENQQTVIKDMQEWYDKSRDSAKAIRDLTDEMQELYTSLRDIPNVKADKAIDKLSNKLEHLKNVTDRGFQYTNTSYTTANSNLDSQTANLRSQRDQRNTAKITTANQLTKDKNSVTNALKGKKTGVTKKQKTSINKAIKAGNKIEINDNWSTAMKKAVAAYNASIDANITANENYLTANDEYLSAFYENASKKLDNITDWYNSISEKFTSKAQEMSTYVDLTKLEGAVYSSGSKVFDAQKSALSQNKSTAKTEYEKYLAEVNKQIKAGTLKSGTKAYNEAMSQINNLRENYYSAAKESQEFADSLKELDFTNLENAIDRIQSRIDRLKGRNDYAESIGNKKSTLFTLNENSYAQVINADIDKLAKSFEEYNKALAEQKKYTIGSDKWNEYAEKVNSARDEVINLAGDIEDMSDKIREIRWKAFEDGLHKIQRVTEELETIRGLLNENNFIGKDGLFTSEGLANLSLYAEMINQNNGQINVLRKAIDKFQKDYDNNNISLDELNEKTEEYMDQISDLAKTTADYRQNVLDSYLESLERQNELLSESINRRKDALQSMKDYYDYQKTIRTKSRDIANIQNQIAALSGTTSKSGQSKLASLRNQLQELNEDMADTKWNHELELRSEGYDKLQSDADKAFETITDSVRRNTDLQNQIITQMLNNAQLNTTQTIKLINDKIQENGLVVSSTTQKTIENLNSTSSTLGNLGLKYGDVKSSAEQFKTANNIANASIIDTSNAAEKATGNLLKLKDAYEAVQKVINLDTSKVSGTSSTTSQLSGTVATNKTSNASSTSTSKTTTTTEAQKKAEAAKNAAITQATKEMNLAKEAMERAKANLDKAQETYNTAKKTVNDLNAKAKKAKTAADLKAVEKALNTANNVLMQASSNLNAVKTAYQKSQTVYNNATSNLSKVKAAKYAKGSKYIKQDQLGWTQDEGGELIYRRKDGAILTPLGQGDMVFTADMSENLWQMAKGNVNDGIRRNVVDNSKVVTINNSPSFDVSFDNFINIEGNADQNTLKDMEKVADKQIDKFAKQMSESFKLMGYKQKFR